MKRIIFVGFAIASLSGSAQKVVNKLTFQTGQTVEVTTNMNMTTQSQMGEMPASVVMVDKYVVGEAAPGQTQLTKTPKRMKVSFSMMGQEMNLDSDNPQDLDGQFGEPIKELMKQKQEFTVDAAGQVIAVKADDKKKKAESDAGIMGMMLPGMNMGAGPVAAGQASVFKILPAGAVVKGDTWSDTVNIEGNKSKIVYTVKDITADELLLDFTGEGNTKTKQSAMGMSVDVSATTKSNGTITIDKATGLLKQKTTTATTESNMNMGGREMTTTTKMTAVTSVKTM